MRAPSAVVVGATDLGATAAFLGHFGFVEATSGKLDGSHARDLYGLEGATKTRLMVQPGSRGGHISLVQTPHAGTVRGVFDQGPLALDIYTTDLDADLASLNDAGVAVGTPGRLELGPLVMRQVQITAPDGWRLVLVEANHRRPTVLDAPGHKGRHSEVHSQLWTVPDLDEAAAEWIKAGFAQTHVFPIAHPELAKILELPSPDTGLRMNLLVGDEQDPVRVELVEFPDNPGAPEVTDSVLRAGVHALWFVVDDLDGPVASRLTDARRVVTKRGEAVVGLLGGVRVECWQKVDLDPPPRLGRFRRPEKA
ncbi:MAG: hypothetical protein ACI867_001413 [Glaciecola sp.]